MPQWVKRGRGDFPLWLARWAEKPCDLLFLGPRFHLTTLYLLLKHFHPKVWIDLVDLFDLKTYKSFEKEDEYVERWGSDQPLDVGAVFITGIKIPTQSNNIKSMKGLIRHRRGARLLTVVQWDLAFSDWKKEVDLDMPLVIKWNG